MEKMLIRIIKSKCNQAHQILNKGSGKHKKFIKRGRESVLCQGTRGEEPENQFCWGIFNQGSSELANCFDFVEA